MNHDLSKNIVILDNATVRTAFIALGLLEPPVNLPLPIKMFDTHVSAAETLIESLLLHDQIRIPRLHTDDYPDLIAIAQSVFGEDSFSEISLRSTQISGIETLARRDLKHWGIANRNLTQRLREFAGVESSSIKWDKYVFAKYSEASAYYCWYPYQQEIKDFYIENFDDIDRPSKKQLGKFISKITPFRQALPNAGTVDAILLWLTYRTSIYDAISWAFNLPYIPHPYRASIWKAINFHRSQPALFAQAPIDILLDARTSLGEQVNDLAGFNVYDLNIPPFFTYALKKASTPSGVIDAVNELRQSEGVLELRNKLFKVTQVTKSEGSFREVQKLRNEFNSLSSDLKTEFQVKEAPTISPAIQLTSVIGIQFDVKIPRQLTELWSTVKVINKPHLAFLRDVFKTTSDVWKLSSLYDNLYRNKRALLKSTIVQPKLNTRQVHYAVLDLYDRDDNLREKDMVQDPNLVTPQQCRQTLHDFIVEFPNETCSLLLIDINDFDLINRQYGHKEGDELLFELALAIREASPKLITQIAGDTFMVVLLGESPIRWLGEFGKLIPKIIKRLKIKFSVSIGKATIKADGTSADELLKVAYHKLQIEKKNKYKK